MNKNSNLISKLIMISILIICAIAFSNTNTMLLATSLINSSEVQDVEKPVIEKVTTDTAWVEPNQTFIVDASDDTKVTGYIITRENAEPSLSDSRWQESNKLKVSENGIWYIFVKDGAAKISNRQQVNATWVTAGVWDVSENQDKSVQAIVTKDGKELIIQGNGITKDFETYSAPWLDSYQNTITKITVQSGITSLGNNLLANLQNVTTIDIANTVEEIVDGSFAYTNNFETLELNNNSNLVYENGTLYNASKTELYVHTTKYVADYKLPSSVTKICAAAFANSIAISNLELTNVKEIQDYAFNGCTNLINQYIPKTVEKVGINAFKGALGPIYFYSSCDGMKMYANGGKLRNTANLVEIDDVKPVINNFTINNNDLITESNGVTLNIDAWDNIALSKIIIETSLTENITSGDTRWLDYEGEPELSYYLPDGIVTIYIWVMDTNYNISEIAASDTIIVGANNFNFEHNDVIVQYRDTTGKNYYKFDKEVQGKYIVNTQGYEVTVDDNIDTITTGIKEVVYTLRYEGTVTSVYQKTVDVIEDSWNTEKFTYNGFEYVKHSSGNYAKIIKAPVSNAVKFPRAVIESGVSYKVIEIESIDENPVVSTTTASVELPDTVISIGRNAFINCLSLTNINLTHNIQTIEENAFKNTGLTILTMNDNVRVVKENAFENTHINSLYNSKLLKSIGANAFRLALNTFEVAIPETIDNISEGAFAGSLIDLISIEGETGISNFAVYNDSILVDKVNKILLQYATGTGIINLECAEMGITKVGEGAFMNALNLQELYIQDNYTSLGKDAFRNTKIKNLEIPMGVTQIKEYTFAGNINLETLVLGGASEIAPNAFEGVTNLVNFAILSENVLPISNVSEIPSNAKIYVLDKSAYDKAAIWSTIASRIENIFRLNGSTDLTIEAGSIYEEQEPGVYIMSELLKTTSMYPNLKDLGLEITTTVDNSILGIQVVTYNLEYRNQEIAKLTRNVNVVDIQAPIIDSIIKLNEPQVEKEKITINASDNHEIWKYAVTQTDTMPALESTLWTQESIVYPNQNGKWYVWVVDVSGNSVSGDVEITDICLAKWDIGEVSNTVFAYVTFKNELIIQGEGKVKYFEEEEIPWKDYLSQITKIEVEEGITTLEKYTLANMVNVDYISLPSTLTQVETSTFAKTNNFSTLEFPNGTDTFIYDNYSLLSNERKILYVHTNKDTNINYAIDSSVLIVGEYAFANNGSITTLTVASDPKLLEGALYNISSLERVLGRIGGEKIEKSAFENCIKLTSVDLSYDLKYIGAYAFSNCNSITTLELKDSKELSTLEHHAFANLNKLQEIRIVIGLKEIIAAENGEKNVFENMGSDFPQDAKVYYYQGCNVMEEYAKNYADENVEFKMIDEIGPKVESLKVTNLESGTYSSGTVLQITAIMTEEFDLTKGTIPEMTIAFGDGAGIKLRSGTVNGMEIIYTYCLEAEDLGELICSEFLGELYDELDNKTVFSGSVEFTEKEIFARSGVLVESDAQDDKYLPTLYDAAEYITSNATVTMLLDESAIYTSIFKANTLVALNLNGKNITLNTTESEKAVIVNKGILNISDLGNGKIEAIATNGDSYGIKNEATLTIASGIVSAQAGANATSYGIYNNGEFRQIGGTISSSTEMGTAYSIFNNKGNTNIELGQVTSTLSQGTNGSTTGIYIQEGKVVIGKDDESINFNNPSIYSTKEGLRNVNGTLEVYDGVIEGEIYKSFFTNNLKVIEGYSLVRSQIGDREKAILDFDVVRPKIEIENLESTWTNSKILLEVKFVDNESGIKEAYFGNEKLELENNTATIEIISNGNYSFSAEDFAGNTITESIVITNIDKIAPTFENLTSETLSNQKEVTIKVTLKDNASGVYGYSLTKYEIEPTSFTKIENTPVETNLNISVTSNGKYYLYAIDNAGNISKYNDVINIATVDTSSPIIESIRFLDNGRGYEKSSVVMLEVKAKDDIGVKEILLSNVKLTNAEVLGSQNFVPYSEQVLWTLPIGDGTKTVYVWVKDGVGRISQMASVTTRLLAEYIGNDGVNNTSFKFLVKDANYDFNKQLAISDIYIKVKNSSNVETYRGANGEGITLTPAPIVYGPIQEGTQMMNGRYYYVQTQNIRGNGRVYICLENTAETDIVGNQISSSDLEIETDVIVELNKPIINITSTAITVSDADGNALDVIRVSGKTIRLINGSVTKSDIINKYGINLTENILIEAIDRCGNIKTTFASGGTVEEHVHTWIAATCTTPKTCESCGATEGDSNGHTIVIDEAVAPTCTKPGLTAGSHCSVCGNTLVAQQEIPATGHTPDEETGTRCTVCGEPLTPEEYTITYNLNGGKVEIANPEKYTKYQVITLNNPTKTGYNFIGWTWDGETTPQETVTIAKWTTGNKEYTANYEARTDTKYTVNHWQQKIDGLDGKENQNSDNYELVTADSYESEGITDTNITPPVIQYTGFEEIQPQTVKISGDGTTVVDYYYTRTSYTVTLGQGTGIASLSGAGTYKYGKEVTINAEVSEGYVWSKWTGTYDIEDQESTITVTGNITLTATTIFAQALYLEDQSLVFVRGEEYSAGDTYSGENITAVYSGFETDVYTRDDYTGNVTTPWNAIHENVTSVVVKDEIIPVSTAYWFIDFTNCETFNIAKLNTSNVEDMKFMFAAAGENVETFELDLSGFDTSKVTNMEYLFYYTGEKATTFELNLTGWDTSQVINMSNMFANAGYDAPNYKILGLSSFDTSNVEDMSSMLFAVGYNSTTWVLGDLSGWKTEKVENMSGMFSAVGNKIEKIDMDVLNIGNWNTSSVTDMLAMFQSLGANSIEINLDLSGWNVSNVQNMSYMFIAAGTNATTVEFNLNGWNTSQVTDMSGMFDSCSVKELDLSSWNTLNVNNISNMFDQMNKLERITIGENFSFTGDGISGTSCVLPTPDSTYIEGADGNWYETTTMTPYLPENVPSKVAATYIADGRTPQAIYSSTDSSLTFIRDNKVYNVGDTYDNKTVTAVYTGFETTEYATEEDVPWKDYRGTDIKKVVVKDRIIPTSTAYWFYDFMACEYIDVSNLDTSHVKNMEGTFAWVGQTVANLTAIGINDLDTRNVENMNQTFGGLAYGQTSAVTLDLSNWKTGNVKTMEETFYYVGYNAPSLTITGLEKWDTSNVTSMRAMFQRLGYGKSTEINISGMNKWQTIKLENMQQMFQYAGYNATTWDIGDISDWNTSKVTNMNSILHSTGKKVEEWYVGDLGKWDVSSVKDMSSMFESSGTNSSSWSAGNLENWNTHNVEFMDSMFSNAGKEATTWSIGNLSKWNTTKVTDITHMFSSTGMNADIWDVGNLSTKTVTRDDGTTYTAWDTSKVTDMERVFYNAGQNATTFNFGTLSGWNTDKVRYMASMFKGCNVSELDLSSWNTSNVEEGGISGVFDDAKKLQKITIGENFSFTGNGSTSCLLPTPDPTYITGADGYWYNETTGTQYVPEAIPSNVLATYITTAPEYEGPMAQAVFTSDGTLRFIKSDTIYKVGDPYNGKTVKSVYTRVDNAAYASEYSKSEYRQITKAPWKEIDSQITSVVVEDAISPISTAGWFTGLRNCVSLDLTNLNVSKVTNMEHMFSDTGYLASTSFNITGLNNWDVSNLKNAGYLFNRVGKGATSWSIGDLSNWNVSNVTNMESMFYEAAENATSFNIGNLGNWDTSNVTSMNGMFCGVGYNNLSTFNIGDISNWNTSKVTDMRGMFNGAGNRASTWTIGNLNTKTVTRDDGTTYTAWDTSKVTDMCAMFASTAYNATTWNIGDLNNWDTSKVTNMSSMFSNVGGYSDQTTLQATVLDLSDWDTSNVTNMHSMFSGFGSNAATWAVGDLSNWDTSKVTDMGFMFSNAAFATTNAVDIGDLSTKTVTRDDGTTYTAWDISQVTYMRQMFYSFGSRVTSSVVLTFNDWNPISVESMSEMFQWTGFNALTVKLIGLDTWDTSNVQDMGYMFCRTGSNRATTWSISDITGWDTSNVTDMTSMFYEAGKNVSYKLNLKGWVVNNVTAYTNFNYGVTSKVTAPTWVN